MTLPDNVMSDEDEEECDDAPVDTGPLHEAAAIGDLEGVTQWCMQQGEGLSELIDEEDESEEVTALYQAADNGHASVVAKLLELGADPEAGVESVGCMPLHAASYRGHLDAVHALLNGGADADAKNCEGETPLSYLVGMNGNPEVAAALLAAGACVDSRGCDGDTPLLAAALLGHEALVTVLMEGGADPNLTGEDHNDTALLLSASGGYVAALKAMFRGPKAATPNTRSPLGRTPLVAAADSGKPGAVAALLEAGADPNAPGEDGACALIGAVYKGCDASIRLLVAAGADLNHASGAENLTPLSVASSQGNLGCMATLLELGADIDRIESEQTALLNLVFKDSLDGQKPGAHLPAIRALLKAGADPNRAPPGPLSPLTVAAAHGNAAVVAELLAAGADPNDDRGGTMSPLTAAATGDQLEVLAMLLEAGAEVDLGLRGNCTALLTAFEDSRQDRVSLDAVKALLDAGADPNARNTSGYTPLDRAITSDHPAAFLRALLDAGAKPSIPSPTTSDRGNQLPIELAGRCGNEEAVRELVAYGGSEAGYETAFGMCVIEGLEQGALALAGAPGFEVNSAGFHGRPPLWLAAEGGLVAVVEALLAAGADPNGFVAVGAERDDGSYGGGSTALSVAAQEGHLGCVKALLRGGASAAGVPGSASPLVVAVFNGQEAIVRALLDAGSDPGAGETLHVAAASGHKALVKLLVEAGAEVDAPDANRNTPLCLATMKGHAGAVAALIKAGADLMPPGVPAPVDVAMALGLHSIARMLAQAGLQQFKHGLGE